LVVGVILMLSVIFCGARETDSFFRTGIEAYNSAEFDRAAEAFQNSVSQRPTAGGYQNLGLAEWQRNRVGPAILAWEKSLWLNSFDRAVRNNLRFARKAAQVESPDLSWTEVISGWLPVNWWSWIMCSSLWLAIAAITLPNVFRVPKASWHQAVAAFGLMVFLLSLPAQIGVHSRVRSGFVLQNATPLRLTPTAEAQIIAPLPAGEPLRWMRARG